MNLEKLVEDCRLEMDKLLHQQCVYTDSKLLPAAPGDRYELLKNLYAGWFFYYYKKEYLIKALGEDDLHAVNAELYKLDLTRGHLRLEDTAKARLYGEALEYMQKEYRHEMRTSVTEERIQLLIYILIEAKFFERFLVSEKEFRYITDQYIARVYGKYVLFYEYLKTKQSQLEGRDAPKVAAQFGSRYETKTLETIFLPGAIEEYLEIELRLLHDGYIDGDCQWLKSLNECAALVNKLLTCGYLKKKSNRNSSWVAKTCKPFFEERYRIGFTKQMQPKYRESKKLSPYFTWIKTL